MVGDRLLFFAVAGMLTATRAFAVADVNLTSMAVKDGDGSLVIMRESADTTYWSAAGSYTAPFDGDTSTSIDPKQTDYTTWVGYELTNPCVVTRIRVCGRLSGDGENRIRNCLIEGANQADFSDAVELFDLIDLIPSGWRDENPEGWYETPVKAFTETKTFKYVRIVQHYEGARTFCGNVAEIEFYGVDAESYADYVPDVRKETDLRAYALHDSAGELDIISDMTAPYGTGYEYDKAMDGDVDTFYDPTHNTEIGHYVGYALAKPMTLTRIRYRGRVDSRTTSTHTARLRSCHVEGANSADFSDAVTLHVCADGVPEDWHENPGWIDVAPDATSALNTFRYFRFIDPAGNKMCGNVSEVEFYGMSPDAVADNVLEDPQPPTGLTIGRGDLPQGGLTLCWQVQPGVSESTVLRAFGPGGPWTEMATLTGVNRWTDTSVPAGAVCYYRVSSSFTADGVTVCCTNSATLSPRRWRLLERDPEDMTKFRSGVSLIFKCGQKCWTPNSTQTTWESITNSLMLAFNGILWANSSDVSSAGHAYRSDFADTQGVSPLTCIGVDIGEPAYFAYMRFYSSVASKNKARINGVRLYGSNAAAWNTEYTGLTEPLEWSEQGEWHERESLDSDLAYRYLFCSNPTNTGWNNNVSELQLYGWTESDLAAIAQGVTDLAAHLDTDGAPALSWTVNNAYGTFTVERRTGDGGWMTVAESLPASTTVWKDTTAVCGTRYFYRVTALNGTYAAYSEDIEIVPYVPGGGTGLHGVWSAGYTGSDVGETVAEIVTNSVIDFKDVSVGGSTENFFVRWTGKLIVPFDGDYTFDAEADDTVALWIGDRPVLYRRALDGTVQTAPGGAVQLTAGEHDIVMTWYQRDGGNVCRLYWGGAVSRSIIPSTQLRPVPVALPDEWAGARTFDGDTSVNNPGDVRFNADGSIELAYGGSDLYKDENGYGFLWRPVKGDFDCSAKISLQTQGLDSYSAFKGGLMVRSALDAAAPFEACLVKSESSHLVVGGKRCSARGDEPADAGTNLDGNKCWSEKASDDDVCCWLRLRRRGDVITYSYRKVSDGAWKDVFRFDVSEAGYGDTVYVGPASTAYEGYVYSVIPNYIWRFTDVRVSPRTGMRLILK